MTEKFRDHLEERLAGEASNSHSLSQELNAIPFPERMRLAREVEQIVNSDPTGMARVELTSVADEFGEEHLIDMQSVTRFGRVDIYNLPGSIDQMRVSNAARLRLDRYHSDNLRRGNRNGVGIFTLPSY